MGLKSPVSFGQTSWGFSYQCVHSTICRKIGRQNNSLSFYRSKNDLSVLNFAFWPMSKIVLDLKKDKVQVKSTLIIWKVLENCILFPKLFWPTVRTCKKIEIPRTIYLNSEMSVPFLKHNYFLTCSWRFLRSCRLE